jgi:hypothetical protein
MEDGLFERARLETASGELVANVKIPNFVAAYEALHWDGRFFAKRAELVYVEASTYYVLPEFKD